MAKRASSSRPSSLSNRRTASLAALALGLFGAVAAGAALLRRQRESGDPQDRASSDRSHDPSFGTGEHRPTDLEGDHHPGAGERAPEAFRPDPTASIPEGERDQFRPALARPTLVETERPAEARADTAGGSTLNPQGGRVTTADQPAGNNMTSSAGAEATSPEPDRVATPSAPGVGNL